MHYTYFRYLFMACILLWGSKGFTQDAPDIFEYPAIQSPNAYSLGKYGDIPVGLYTGIPDISIPITSISAGAFTLPISLNYHGGGIKAEEKASWVGLGWSLKAGGVITRSARGILIDESIENYEGGYLRKGDMVLESSLMDWVDDDVNNNDTTEAENLLGRIGHKGNMDIDSEPDVFFFNFGSYSGHFVLPLDLLDEDGSINSAARIYTVPHSNLDITVNAINDDFGITSWTIVDEQGVKYTFNVTEAIINNYQAYTYTGGEDDYNESSYPDYYDYDNTSWFLSEIEVPNSSEKITLTYADPDTVVYHSMNVSVNNDYVSSTWPITDGNFLEAPHQEVVSSVSVQVARRLTSIQNNSTKITFGASDRFDVPRIMSADDYDINDSDFLEYSKFVFDLEAQEFKLNTITQSRKQGGFWQQEKAWGFDYGYFNESSSYQVGHTATVNEPDFFKRLRLDAVTVLSTDNNEGERYAFEYNEPQFPYQYFDYETDSKKTFVDGNGDAVKVTLPPYLDWAIFAVDNGIEYKYNGREYLYLLRYLPAVDHWGFFNGKFANALANVPFLDYSGFMHQPDGVDRRPDEIYMKAGVLKRITYPTGGYTEFDFEVNKYDAVGEADLGLNLASAKIAGGLRIKEIRSYSSEGEDPVVKHYSYTENNGTESSGVLVNEPAYMSPFFLGYETADKDFIYWGFNSSSLIPLGTTLGGIVGYKEVKITSGEGHGYEISTYTSPQEYPDTFYKAFFVDINGESSGGDSEYWYSYLMNYYTNTIDIYDEFTGNYDKRKWGFGFRTNVDSRRGKLKTHTVYNQSGQKLQRTENSYFDNFRDESDATGTRNIFYGLSVNNLEVPNATDIWDEGGVSRVPFIDRDSYVIIYEHISSWNYLKNQKVITYNAVNGASMYTVTEFEYDPGHLQLTEKTETNSNGEERVTEYEYAHQNHQPAMGTLNMLTQPYSVTVKDGSENVLSKNWTLWKNWGTSSSPQWLPCGVWLWEGGTVTPPANCSSN